MKKRCNKTGLGDRIAAARKHAGLSQTDLGKAFGLTRSAVSQWESENTEPTPANLRAIAVRCGVDYDWLATRRGHMIKKEDSSYLIELIELLREAEGDPEILDVVSAVLKSRKAAKQPKPELASEDRFPSSRK